VTRGVEVEVEVVAAEVLAALWVDNRTMAVRSLAEECCSLSVREGCLVCA